MKGFIHSLETFGTVDGPGIRLVLFLQGCPMRCQYCHNPDTWEIGGGSEITVEEILARYRKNRFFYENGGITVTGGEPLLQLDFVTALFQEAKADGIHTCLDTSGAVFHPEHTAMHAKLDALLSVTDLVMLDLKHIDSEAHRQLTGMNNTHILAFARYLEQKQIPVWIRHVVVPGITDDPGQLERLGKWIGTLQNLNALDVIPYHTMGVEKYRALGIPYPLEHKAALSKEKAMEAKAHILRGIHAVRTVCAEETES